MAEPTKGELFEALTDALGEELARVDDSLAASLAYHRAAAAKPGDAGMWDAGAVHAYERVQKDLSWLVGVMQRRVLREATWAAEARERAAWNMAMETARKRREAELDAATEAGPRDLEVPNG